jgi:hypothetical protein
MMASRSSSLLLLVLPEKAAFLASFMFRRSWAEYQNLSEEASEECP